MPHAFCAWGNVKNIWHADDDPVLCKRIFRNEMVPCKQTCSSSVLYRIKLVRYRVNLAWEVHNNLTCLPFPFAFHWSAFQAWQKCDKETLLRGKQNPEIYRLSFWAQFLAKGDKNLWLKTHVIFFSITNLHSAPFKQNSRNKVISVGGHTTNHMLGFIFSVLHFTVSGQSWSSFYIKSTTAEKDLWWLVGRQVVGKPPTEHLPSTFLWCSLFTIVFPKQYI